MRNDLHVGTVGLDVCFHVRVGCFPLLQAQTAGKSGQGSQKRFRRDETDRAGGGLGLAGRGGGRFRTNRHGFALRGLRFRQSALFEQKG